MAKTIFFILLSQFCSNGWWYCVTQQSSIGKTPVIMIPIISTIMLIIFFARWIMDNWDD
jgi:hypothetical protein